MAGTLGILAGSGVLPIRIAETAKASGREVFILAFEGQTPAETVSNLPHDWVKLGAVEEAVQVLKSAGCDELVMAGPMIRPSLSSLSLDARGAGIVARLGMKLFGDDGLLSVIVEELEKDGFKIVGVEDLLGGYLIPAGPLVGGELSEPDRADAERGIAVLNALGAADVGQAVAVQSGLVLALEAVEGTDRMIARAGELARQDGAPGPMLVKGTKPGQELRADRPTIGPLTVETAARVGFRGIVVEADETLIVDRAQLAEDAQRLGLFVYAMDFSK